MKSNKQRYKEFVSNQKGGSEAPRPDGGFFLGLVIALVAAFAFWYAAYYGVHAFTHLLGLD